MQRNLAKVEVGLMKNDNATNFIRVALIGLMSALEGGRPIIV